MQRFVLSLIFILGFSAGCYGSAQPTGAVSGGEIYLSDFANFSTAKTAASAVNKALVVDVPGTVSHNMTVTSGLEVVPGNLITITGAILSVQGSVSFPLSQVFAGTGNVSGLGEVIPDWFPGSNDTQRVQGAVNSAAISGWPHLYGIRRYDLSNGPVYIDRPVTTFDQQFLIECSDNNAGFYSTAPGAMFSSTIPYTIGQPVSERITFSGCKWEASAASNYTFAVDGSKLLRLRFINDNTFEKMGAAYSAGYIQTYYFDNFNAFRWKGWFLEAANALIDVKAQNYVMESGNGTLSAGFKADNVYQGCYNVILGPGLFEHNTGPLADCTFYAGQLMGNYTEWLTDSAFKLENTQSVTLTSNFFNPGGPQLADPNYYDVDCQQAINVSGGGNQSYGRMYRTTNMFNIGGDGFRPVGDTAVIALSDVRVANQWSGTGTFTGFSGTVTGPVFATIEGREVTLLLPPISGTSNDSTMTMTGLPTGFLPGSQRRLDTTIQDNTSTWQKGAVVVDQVSVNFYKTLSGDGFTTSGTKGLFGGVLKYNLWPFASYVPPTPGGGGSGSYHTTYYYFWPALNNGATEPTPTISIPGVSATAASKTVSLGGSGLPTGVTLSIATITDGVIVTLHNASGSVTGGNLGNGVLTINVTN